ncbi:DUF4083 family protein [Bacillus sp. 1P06AnD]|uniref:DUF4083 family protein n=1 Tax=Bacillus sp. 1P06AnD TaxID=3132208 RepID=UPI00399F6AE9
MNDNIGDILFQLLILLFIISMIIALISLFRKQTTNKHNAAALDKKMDRIIELLEKKQQ